MSKQIYILSIDQGTTSSRAIVFDQQGQIVSVSQKELQQHFPQDGWVEHDPETIWNDTISVCRDAMFQKNVTAGQLLGIGITNQRETTIIWHRETGKVIYNAIVWQDRRTADYCQQLKQAGHEPTIQKKTGLLLDAYFSASKIRWLLDNVPGAQTEAEKGNLAFGTIDSFLLWRLTKGEVHATDATNASRTLLFNIHTQQWDDELLEIFNIPRHLLPQVKDCSADFGLTRKSLFGKQVPIYGIAGDQQAATIGQACFEPGMVKSTYGTGAFMMLNTGNQVLHSKNRLLSTVAYRLNDQTTYALEGSVFVAGAAMQWLRDQVKMVHHAADSERLAQSVQDTDGVYFVPAFTGLGAPFWEPNARGLITGLTRDSSLAHIVRAGLESVCYRTKDLFAAMLSDGANQITEVRVDGGMVANNWLCQFLADMLNKSVVRPAIIETTALGVAYLVGLKVGLFEHTTDIAQLWQQNRVFKPSMAATKRHQLYGGWQKAIEKVLCH